MVIALIKLKKDKFTLEEIEELKQYDSDIKPYDWENYSYWNYDGKDKEALSHEERRKKVHEEAVRKNQHEVLWSLPGGQIVVDLETFTSWYSGSFDFIRQVRLSSSGNPSVDNLVVTLHKFESKIADLKEAAELFNEKCEVHVGGNMLLTINDLMLCEDYCTDELQNHLDTGWRIVSVNHQPDGRRPDYVLGRYNPEKEPGLRGAARGPKK